MHGLVWRIVVMMINSTTILVLFFAGKIKLFLFFLLKLWEEVFLTDQKEGEILKEKNEILAFNYNKMKQKIKQHFA